MPSIWHRLFQLLLEAQLLLLPLPPWPIKLGSAPSCHRNPAACDGLPNLNWRPRTAGAAGTPPLPRAARAAHAPPAPP
uniref:Leucine-rich repeat-containing N-terminal plant-type domain-containing protein n=1 Tax=Setaria italica TaxID=4555 RepID=K3ZFM6_SETIT